MFNAKKIQGRRKMAGLSQTEAGKIIGVTRPTYASRESMGRISMNDAQKLAIAFGCRMDDLRDAPESHGAVGQIELLRDTVAALKSENATLKDMIELLKSQCNLL